MIDPLVRLRLEDLHEVQPVLLFSALDPAGDGLPNGGHLMTGYTEASTPSRQPALSFSWDWAYDRQARQLEAHWAFLRTNLRVIGNAGEDLGEECTRLCVARLMTRVCWEWLVADALGLHLARPPDTRR